MLAFTCFVDAGTQASQQATSQQQPGQAKPSQAKAKGRKGNKSKARKFLGHLGTHVWSKRTRPESQSTFLVGLRLHSKQSESLPGVLRPFGFGMPVLMAHTGPTVNLSMRPHGGKSLQPKGHETTASRWNCAYVYVQFGLKKDQHVSTTRFAEDTQLEPLYTVFLIFYQSYRVLYDAEPGMQCSSRWLAEAESPWTHFSTGFGRSAALRVKVF